MKKRIAMLLCAAAVSASLITGCGDHSADKSAAKQEAGEEKGTDQEAADKTAALIDAIYVQEWTDKTDEQCAEAKKSWDALTEEQKALVEGENADPDYFGRDTGDASKDDPRNQDEIGEKEASRSQFWNFF